MPRIDLDDLRQIPLFGLLDEQELAALARHLDVERYVQGQMIFTAGETGGEMYLVERGRVEIFMRDKNRQRIRISEIEAGEIFGELSLLDDANRTTSAKALDDNTTVIVVDRNDLLQLFSSHPAAALDILSQLGKRIRTTDALVRNRVVTRNVNEEVEDEMPLNFGQRVSDFLTGVAGNINFVYANLLWFVIWIVMNLNIIPGIEAFDPFPFGLLTMIVSLEAIFLSLFVLISQNRQSERDRVRADIEYQINLKAEVEIREVHERLEELESTLVNYFRRIGGAQRTKPLTSSDVPPEIRPLESDDPMLTLDEPTDETFEEPEPPENVSSD